MWLVLLAWLGVVSAGQSLQRVNYIDSKNFQLYGWYFMKYNDVYASAWGAGGGACGVGACGGGCGEMVEVKRM